MIEILNLDNIYNTIIPNWYYNIQNYNIQNYNNYLNYNNNENQTIKLLQNLKKNIHLQNKYEFIYVNDCGYKKENNIFYHYRHFDGILFNNFQKSLYNNSIRLNVPILKNNLFFTKEYLKNDYEIMKLFQFKNNIKMNIIGPNTFYDFLYNKSNNNKIIIMNEIINNLKYQILSTIEKGCSLFQIDELSFIYNDEIDLNNINSFKTFIYKLNINIILGLHNYDEFQLKPIYNEKKLIQLLELNNIKYYSFDYIYIKKFFNILNKYDKIYIFKLPYKNNIYEYKKILNEIIYLLGHNNFIISPPNFRKTYNELDKIYENIYISKNYINNLSLYTNN
jgi:methionine synthase II (cobalamin-independent)